MKKRLVILGAGESGVGAALLGMQKGYDVFVSDGGEIKDNYKMELKAGHIDFEERQHTAEKILNADEVMKSPGIPEKNELVKQIRAKGIPIISEIELAYRYKGNSKIIAITGSNGKTTTTALTYHICKAPEALIAPWWAMWDILLPNRWPKTPNRCMWQRSVPFSWMISKRSGRMWRYSPISPKTTWTAMNIKLRII